MASRIVTPETFLDWPQDIHPERLFAAKHIQPGQTVLDLGCGRHKTEPWVIGVDLFVPTDVKASLDDLPFPDEFADIILARHSFEHCLNSVRALQEWRRVLKPRGEAVVILPDHACVDTMAPILSSNQHMHAFTADSFQDLVEAVDLFWVKWIGAVVPQWSFGAVLTYSPCQFRGD